MRPPKYVVEAAIRVAKQSPCQKSKRGAAIWTEGAMIASGNNHPPGEFKCAGDSSCRNSCNKVAVHAEAAAIVRAAAIGVSIHGLEMLHVKVVDEELVPSGPPSCWQCSRLILESGISNMWLYHEDGWRQYSASEFHLLTLEHCELPRDI